MKTNESYFIGSDGQTKIAYYTFIPDENPIAILQICHGMAEHFTRYTPFAEWMCAHGVIVCGCDHKGHGKSVPEGGMYGDFGEGKALDVLMNDQKLLIDIMRKKYRYLPYIVLGHSMGSFVLRKMMIGKPDTTMDGSFSSSLKVGYPDAMDGVIICGTAGSGNPLGVGILLAGIVGKFKNTPSPFLGKIAFAGYNKKTGSKIPNAWLTRDSEIVSAYNADPLCGFSFTPSAYKQLFEAIKTVNDSDWAKTVPAGLPTYVIAGDADPVGNYGEGPSEVFESLVEAELCDVDMKLYPGARHEILNETCKEEVYEDILNFILRVADGVKEAKMQASAPLFY